jgi:hypothetical protein
MSTRSIIKDSKLTTLLVGSGFSMPSYPISLPLGASLPGTLAYLASNFSVNYWTGTQWLTLNAGPIQVYSITNTGAAVTSIISNGTGPTFVLKGISAADSTITVASTSDNVTVAGNYSLASVGAGTSFVYNGAGPNFTIKSLNAGVGIDITGFASQTLNISSNVLESIPTQNWKAGTSSVVGSSQCVAVGDSADAGTGSRNIAIGYNGVVSSGTDDSIAIGVGATTFGNQCVSLGSTARAGSIGVDDCIAIGSTAQALAIGAVAIGSGSSSLSANSVCIRGAILSSSSVSVAICGFVGSTSSSSVAIGANSSIGNSSSNCVVIGGIIGSNTTNAVAIRASNNVSNTAVIGTGSSFILGTPGLLQSGAQWGVIAQPSGTTSVSSGDIAFDTTIYDPYSAIASGGTQVTLQKANQLYQVSASILITWSGVGTIDTTVTLTRNGSPSQVICVNQFTASVTLPYTTTLVLSGITVSGNVTTDYITASVNIGGGTLVPSIQAASYINVHRIN